MTEAPADPIFSALRPRLLRLAYRMLGSVSDAEDVVQDAYLRWLAVDRDVVEEPAAYLRTIVTRLSLNLLKSAQRRREAYIGPWLPEPIFDQEDVDAPDDITLPLMMALERLSPLERAAFLLHDVFGMSFDDIAETLGREAATCRKLASRAREHIHADRPRYAVSKEDGRRIAEAFFNASRTGDMQTLRDLLAETVMAYSDGGGKAPASLAPLVGIEDVMKRHADMARDFAKTPSKFVRFANIDGLPGFITLEAGGIVQTTALQIEGDKVVTLFVVRNPDKLRWVSDRVHHEPSSNPRNHLC